MKAAQNVAGEAARPGRAPVSRRPRPAPRKVIAQSWTRVKRDGVDPEHEFGPGLLAPEEVRRRRADSPLREVVPVLRAGLLPAADEARHIMIVADVEGRVLWREGSSPVLRRADEVGLGLGADLSESVAGTNGVGTPAVLRRPVQVFAAEHYVRSLTGLTCAGAPITDPRDGTLLGVVDVSGPQETLHPATLAWVESVAKLAEARLRETHLGSLQRLRAVAAPVLARLGGRAAVVDRDGWTAAVTGMPYLQRITLPKSPSAGACWVPSLGACALEPLDEGWLVRAVEPGGCRSGGERIALDLAGRRRWSVTVSGGAGAWSQELSPRHAELLYLLAVRREGRSAAELAGEVFGDPARTVTVRAEMSRIRRYLGEFLEHRPYRFRDGVEVAVALPGEPGDLLPHSIATAVRLARDSAS
ncbi:GAF domain-containing protein [Streptomyces roseirectus]|uniref:GAF domain-containing protein n=1 Tax=Streptomyces roseirectus TaxID=2768066 RepID=A0A7H0IS90_9ACTN|nr:GAF domain-containing protein [Streptomyces roseirectus]QNP75656.1 GAF domain-containing protein [Streptomyces roseirectus]